MSHYRRHVFFCGNPGKAPEACCGRTDIDGIIERRVTGGEMVKRLRI